MQNRPLNEELLRALAYYGAAGGTGGGGGGGVSAYNDLLGKPIITSEKFPSGITINGTKSLQDYGIAEEIQHFFDLKKSQVATANERMKLELDDTANKTKITLDTIDATITLQKQFGTPLRTQYVKFGPDTIGFGGDALYFYTHSIEDLISSDKLVDVANWSATTTIIGNVDYYTNELSFTKVYVEHPDVVITPMGSTTLPTILEREAFTLVTSTGYFHATLNNNKITCYSQVKPTSSFKISVRGAK